MAASSADMGDEAKPEVSRDMVLDDTTRMSRVWHTVLSMMKDRGYNIPDETMRMTDDDFKRKFVLADGSGMDTLNMRIMARKLENVTESVIVFFCRDFKMSVKTLDEYETVIESKEGNRKSKYQSVIIVLRGKMSPMCSKRMREIELKRSCRIETFTESELIVDITKHYLVPRHIVLNEQEKKELLEDYHLDVDQLPKITTNDPISRHYGLCLGDIVKIIRFSENAGQYVTYRYVI